MNGRLNFIIKYVKNEDSILLEHKDKKYKKTCSRRVIFQKNIILFSTIFIIKQKTCS